MKRRLHDFSGESPRTARTARKKWLAEILESRAVELIIVLLVMVDAMMVLIEAGVQDHVFCVGGRVVECPPAAIPAEGAALAQARNLQDGMRAGQRAGLRTGLLAAQDWQLSQTHSHSLSQPHSPSSEHPPSGVLCPHPGEPVLVCNTKDGHEARHLLHVCHMISVSILCAFVVELSLKWWSNPDEFCSNFYHKLDLFVTVVSLLMDTVVYAMIEHYRDDDSRHDAGVPVIVLSALLILARLWRIVRICHGIFEEIHMVVDEEVARRESARKDASSRDLQDGGDCGVVGPTAARPAD